MFLRIFTFWILILLSLQCGFWWKKNSHHKGAWFQKNIFNVYEYLLIYSMQGCTCVRAHTHTHMQTNKNESGSFNFVSHWIINPPSDSWIFELAPRFKENLSCPNLMHHKAHLGSSWHKRTVGTVWLLKVRIQVFWECYAVFPGISNECVSFILRSWMGQVSSWPPWMKNGDILFETLETWLSNTAT